MGKSGIVFNSRRPYCIEHAGSHLNSVAKRCKAGSVLGWGTAREHHGVDGFSKYPMDVPIVGIFHVPIVGSSLVAVGLRHLRLVHVSGTITGTTERDISLLVCLVYVSGTTGTTTERDMYHTICDHNVAKGEMECPDS